MRSDRSLWGQSDTETQNEMDRPQSSSSSRKPTHRRGYPSPNSSAHPAEEHMHSFMAFAHM